LDPIETDAAAGGVVDLHIAAGAGVGGDRDPIRGEEGVGPLDEIGFAADARPVDDAILVLNGGRLVGGRFEYRRSTDSPG
jgi:hypothetical protein